MGARTEGDMGTKGVAGHIPQVWKVRRAVVTMQFVQGASLWTPGDMSAMA